VGRNESGKSNLLLALWSLNPPGGASDLNPVKDFPRHRRLEECTDKTEVVHTTWKLSPDEQAELATKFPRANGVTHVKIGRYYKAGARSVAFEGLKPIAFSSRDVAARLRKITPMFEAAAEKLEEAPQQQAKAAIDQLRKDLDTSGNAIDWAIRAVPGLANFRKACASIGVGIPEQEDKILSELETLAASIAEDKPQHEAARTWIASLLPLFVYVADYPELNGHQNIAEYLARKSANPSQLTPADVNFEKMCRVAGLDPQRLQQLHTANDHETRNQLANRAGAVVTTELRRLWKDRQLKVRFSPDADHLDAAKETHAAPDNPSVRVCRPRNAAAGQQP
jgi:hypothetical protein